jgi:hypothetical protein
MTFDDAVGAIRRAWWVLALGLAATVVVLGSLWRVPGVYTAQVDLVALPPQDPAPRNVLQDTTRSLSPFAAMVAAQTSQGSIKADTGTTSATLYGAGYRNGFKLTVPNTGGQWNVSHDRPVISVEVVGPSLESVQGTLDVLVKRVQDDAAQVQARSGIIGGSAITFDPAPAQPSVQYVTGRRMRAGAATLAMGGVVSLGAAAIYGRREQRRDVVAEARPLVTTAAP